MQLIQENQEHCLKKLSQKNIEQKTITQLLFLFIKLSINTSTHIMLEIRNYFKN